MRVPTGKLIVLCLLAACVAAPAARAHDERAQTLRKITYYRTVTWRWQTLTGLPRTPANGRAWRTESDAVRRDVLLAWKRLAAKVWKVALEPPHKAGWECIHGGEGPWDANTGNGYYGGLQMDLDALVEARADVGRREGLPRPRLLAVAEHRPRLRPALRVRGPLARGTDRA